MSTDTVIGFHKPEDENGFLSNWYPSSFELEGIKFTSSEQYIMYHKATLFHDDQIVEAILATSDPAEEQDLGRKVKNYDDSIWNGHKQIITYRALLAKFDQNPDLLAKLVDTGDAILAESSYSDKVWGTGRSIIDDRCLDPKQWDGQNLLGYTLMEVRDQLCNKTIYGLTTTRDRKFKLGDRVRSILHGEIGEIYSISRCGDEEIIMVDCSKNIGSAENVIHVQESDMIHIRQEGDKHLKHMAIYQCKLCGEKFQFGEKLDSIDVEASIDSIGDRFDTPSIIMPGTIGHHCSNGSFGVAEFLGYEPLLESGENSH